MRTVLAFLMVTAPLVAAPVPKALKKSPPPLNGTWKAVEWFDDDVKMRMDDDILWTIDGESLTVAGVKELVPVGFARNATRTITRPDGGGADALDYTITYSDGTPPGHRTAVFELTGDRLRFCMTTTDNRPRLTECKPAEGTRTYLFERVDAAK